MFISVFEQNFLALSALRNPFVLDLQSYVFLHVFIN